MAGGYTGKILFVDLSDGKITEESLGEELCREFIGGYGIGAKIIYDRQKPGVDALGPNNTLGFVTGPLTGTPALVGARYVVVGKSPLTGTWGDANCGGSFGPALKFAGYDAVFFIGTSEKPVYLIITEGQAELNDATKLWGKDTNETEDLLKDELGEEAEVSCIGPAGEKLALISGVITAKGRAAARSGLGAVMGSKKLKAVVVRGNKEVPLADERKVKELRRKYLRSMSGPRVELLRQYGTCGNTAAAVISGDSPIKNWGGTASLDFPNAEAISDDNVIKYEQRKFACWRCPLACGGYVKVMEGAYTVEGHKPEYETLAAFGTMCLNDNVESIIKLNDVCNRYGLDTMSTGATIAFAIECYENGLITREDTDGIELRWGNAEAIVAMTEQLARREGLGDILADGVRVAAEKIGKGAEKYAIHIQGQEAPFHDPKFFPGFALAYQLAATPARHTQCGESLKPPGITIPFENRGELQKRYDSLMHIVNAAGLCELAYTRVDAHSIPDFIGAVTGWDFTLEDCFMAGERIATIRHAFNLREGLNPLKFKVPGRVIGYPALGIGNVAGPTVDIETQNREYLEAMDWDLTTTVPSARKLAELGLEDVAHDLDVASVHANRGL
jgi:aldehyde:ferredoxin oxidoreductase